MRSKYGPLLKGMDEREGQDGGLFLRPNMKKINNQALVTTTLVQQTI
jgi:hypothetical protein